MSSPWLYICLLLCPVWLVGGTVSFCVLQDPSQASRKEGHLVSHVRVHETEKDSWYLFNDFCVSQSSLAEAMGQV